MKSLLAFQAVMTEGTVTAAAARLHRTQSVISRQILDLEHRLKFTLFRREKQRLIPTTAGLAFYREAERAFAALAEIETIANAVREGQSLPLRILVPSHILHGLMPGALNRFALHEPNFRFVLEIRQREYISRWIRNRQYDLGVAPDVEEQTGIDREPLVEAPIFVVMPSKHPLASEAMVRLKDLAQHRIVAVQPGTPMRRLLDRSLTGARIQPVIWGETGSVLSACQLAVRCEALAIADPFTASLFASDSNAVIRPLSPRLEFIYSLIRPSDNPKTSRDEKLAECLRMEAQAQIKEVSRISQIGFCRDKDNGQSEPCLISAKV